MFLSITFQTQKNLAKCQSMSVLGNHPLLGDWVDIYKHPLKKSSHDENIWVSIYPLKIPYNSFFEYKFVIINQNQIIYWESPSHLNRKLDF